MTATVTATVIRVDSPALRAMHVSKTFVGTRVLHSLDLTIGRGEVHALLGENGSGKSTFIKILAGYHSPDPGCEVRIGGKALGTSAAESSHSLGIRFVHQDLGLVDSCSVLDNFSLVSGYPRRWGTIRRAAVRRTAEAALDRVGLTLDLKAAVGSLSPVEKTGLAVARALGATDGELPVLLVLDEPTATLPNIEVDRLLSIVRSTAQRGVGVLYVTHRLGEIFDIADTTTVLRDGRRVVTVPTAELDRPTLIHHLVGREFDEVRQVAEKSKPPSDEPVVLVENLVADRLAGVSLKLYPGDLVGVAGITGSGREALCGTIFGALPRHGGKIVAAGKVLPPLRPTAAMELGLAYIPADRRNLGSITELSARENLTLSSLRPFWRRLLLRRSLERAETDLWAERLDVRPRQASEQKFSAFSGGNQQKLLFGKWLRRGPAVIMIDEPTQGVDVGAKATLHQELLAAAAAGAAVVVSSSDTDELAALCKKVFVLRDGEIVAVLTNDEITVPSLTAACNGSEMRTAS